MGLTDTDVVAKYNANGVTTSFAITHAIITSAQSETEVYVVDESVTPITETLQSYSTHYTIVGSNVVFGAAPANGLKVLVGRKMALQQNDFEGDVNGPYPADDAETAYDRIWATLQMLNEKISRSVKFRKSFLTVPDPQIADPVARACLIWNTAADAIENGPSIDTVTGAVAAAAAASASAASAAASATSSSGSAAAASTSAAAALASELAAAASEAAAAASAGAITGDAAASAASAAAALVSENNAFASETNAAASEASALASSGSAATSETNAATSETNAANSASAALTSENNAAASAAAAALSAAGGGITTVVYLTVADSPKSVIDADLGTLFVCDTTGGAITINLPSIAGLTPGGGNLAFTKSDGSGNSVSIAPNGTDEINQGPSAGLSTQGEGLILVPDTTATPDNWGALQFGVTSGGPASVVAASTFPVDEGLLLADGTGRGAKGSTITETDVATAISDIATLQGANTGTNSGDVTIGAFGSTPDAKGASITGQAITMQPADATNPGMVTTGAQTFAGAKTFSTAIAIGSGGTGQTTKAAAFDALSPMTTSGDVIYGGASGTGTRLAKGSNGDVLTLAAGLPSWAAPTGGGGSMTDNESSSCGGGFSTSSTSPVDVTNLSVSLTTTGKRVFLELQGDGTSNVGAIGVFRSGATSDLAIDFLEGSNLKCRQHMTTNGSGEIDIPPSSFRCSFALAAGTYTFKVQAAVTNGSATGYVQWAKLVAWTTA